MTTEISLYGEDSQEMLKDEEELPHEQMSTQEEEPTSTHLEELTPD